MKKIILGIDPGLGVSGFGVLIKEQGKTGLLDYGYLKLNPDHHLSKRVHHFHDFFEEKIKTLYVTELALETPFLGKNTQSFLKLGYLRGILYLLAERHSLVIHEFSPMEVKRSVTGYGGASKDQVSSVILRLFPRLETPKKLDVTDALAITLCGMWNRTNDIFSKKNI